MSELRSDELPTKLTCVDCGKLLRDYEAYERRGMIYCGEHLLNTAEKRAYEHWFVKE
jgi:hypothetical protein